MSQQRDVHGAAALAICESLLLALNDRKILPEREIIGILRDAAASHANTPPGDGKEDMHRDVADRKSTRLNSSHVLRSRMPSSA